MFDKMIVSEASHEGSGRNKYFLVSTLAVVTLFFTAVVFSLYAANIGLGSEEFDISTMIAPVTPTAPEPPRPETPVEQGQPRDTKEPTRVRDIPRIEESPTAVPDTVSVEPSKYLSRPTGQFKLDNYDSGSAIQFGRTTTGRDGDRVGSSVVATQAESTSEIVRMPEPPPAIVKKPEPPRSLGVITGKATVLPKPVYSPAAIQVKAQGDVTVQVTIDELGKVVSAKAVSGHPLLKRESERAAMNARFSPTTLSKVPVKVTGMIVYTFRRN